MDFSPILFTALTLLSSCTLTALATPAEGLSTSPIEDGPLPNIVLFAMAEIKDDANPVDQHNATATPSALSSAVTRGAGSCVDVNSTQMDFARVVDAGVLEEVVSVNASKYLFSVTVVCSKGWDEVSGFVGGVL
ncbi:hypothetical protein PMAA_066150 [Talaromyces marneffei ATCC 18224]|uniref:Uncharacterized protein n=1 Tax=Talaromyces marneffei (strain ATCC 18224 / CBS 334.59 / QM 7333) TaxID=441960 RepID=B6QBU9_TALMQ|nr:hypothetical protein PMAA_066150 [Talaromyces marneffei ATCC 18224]